jgi:hypothetical protein
MRARCHVDFRAASRAAPVPDARRQQMKKSSKKLVVSKETVRALGTKDLSRVAGGTINGTIANCHTEGVTCHSAFCELDH